MTRILNIFVVMRGAREGFYFLGILFFHDTLAGGFQILLRAGVSMTSHDRSSREPIV